VSAPRTARAVILDRDGTIVVDRGYLHDPKQLQLLPGAAAGLRELHRAGHLLVVITNQSGIGRGLFTLAQLQAVNRRFSAMLEEAGAPLSGLYFCPHRPEDGCACRKPGAALLREAAVELGFVPAEAVVIGDKSTDIELGKRVGAATILVCAGTSPSDGKPAEPDFIVQDLREAARIIGQLGTTVPAVAAARQGG